jgi:lysophospholipase L1-like esterase
MPAMDKVMHYTTNNVGFRGDSLVIPKPANETRIFIIGGSTAQCLYIDDSKSLDRVLQKDLQQQFPGRTIKVYSAAKSGDGTAEHIAMLSQRIIHMQPDMVIVFCGFNDLRKSIQRYDYRHLGAVKQYSPRYIFMAATRFQVGRRLYYLMKSRSEDEIREEIPLATNHRELFAIQQQTPESDSIPYINAQPFSTNLKTIAGICSANGVPLVLMPNQSTWNSRADTSMRNKHWLLTMGKIRYKEEYLQKGLEVFNDTMRAVAVQNSLPLFDLPEVMPPSGEYFYDDCHFNNNGSVTAAKMLAAFISPLVSTFQYK